MLRYVAGVALGKLKMTLGIALQDFEMGNKPVSLFQSPILVPDAQHFQYEGGQIQQAGSSVCGGRSQKLNLASVTKEI